MELISDQTDHSDKDEYLKLFAVYFSLIDDGNVCMSLDKAELKEKWNAKVNSVRISKEESSGEECPIYDDIVTESDRIIDAYLDNVTESEFPEIIGAKKIFAVDDGFLYLHKYDIARKGVRERVLELFGKRNKPGRHFDVDSINAYRLSDKQSLAVDEGYGKNLIITGGPGCGKTTSILFLLLNLLQDSTDYVIYLVAPSGKASSRMKDSIIGGLSGISQQYKDEHQSVIDIIRNLEESTIHKLLAIDSNTGIFTYNREHKFADNSLFIIDEASMIDICLFHSLLEAVPDTARLFIMGDKNQLPSVESGAVFGELLRMPELKDNVIELTKSQRFGEDTDIYKLAGLINAGGSLDYIRDRWEDCEDFTIREVGKEKPIYYYDLEKCRDRKAAVAKIASVWADKFYKELQEKATDLDYSDSEYLSFLFDLSENGKILSAENEGIRGVKEINKLVRRLIIDKTRTTSVIGQYAGQIMMINSNNKRLDLYNGDSGILVTFKDDPTLYFMVKKSSILVEKDGKLTDKIFKLGDFVFYPLRMIASSEIDLAYAITIHKSQGSDYRNILVILPTRKGHPLLNRQIVYTAITRTKGNTYIVSSQSRLEEAKDNVIVRDTNIA